MEAIKSASCFLGRVAFKTLGDSISIQNSTDIVVASVPCVLLVFVLWAGDCVLLMAMVRFDVKNSNGGVS